MTSSRINFSVWEFVDRIFSIHEDGYHWRKEQHRQQKALKQKPKHKLPKLTWKGLKPRTSTPPPRSPPKADFPYETQTAPVSRASSPILNPQGALPISPEAHSPPTRVTSADQNTTMSSLEQNALEEIRSLRELHSQQRMAPGIPIQRVERHKPRVRYAGIAACRSPRKAVVTDMGPDNREGSDDPEEEVEDEGEEIACAVDYHAVLEDITRSEGTNNERGRRRDKGVDEAARAHRRARTG